ncbi:cytochrome b561 [Arsukibacterium tuosuense]|uniref:Cytochrome b561 n=1 Tax=Arsukibacterium tuosuense TaxID=1323745 RepID=A0A285JM43_9GAMM|nr:cytochrome b [Arsukibacterium tuosuense]SNY60406.1 cytochrome b561 [Arsukibacterium tuosuense]
MQATNPGRYPGIMIVLHWLTALLFVLVYCSMEFRDVFEKGTDARNLIKTAHYAFGLSIFIVFWFRILARKLWPAPPHSNVQPEWQRYLMITTHSALYLLMLVQPLLGWLLVNAEHSSTIIFGITLPQLLSPDAGIADWLEELHEIVASAGYLLIGLHSAAALFHHYLLKDNTMRKMLFAGKRQR